MRPSRKLSIIHAKLSSASNDPVALHLVLQNAPAARCRAERRRCTTRSGVVDDAHVGRLGRGHAGGGLALQKPARRRRRAATRVRQATPSMRRCFVRCQAHGRHRAEVRCIASLLCEQRRSERSAENDSKEKPACDHVTHDCDVFAASQTIAFYDAAHACRTSLHKCENLFIWIVRRGQFHRCFIPSSSELHAASGSELTPCTPGAISLSHSEVRVSCDTEQIVVAAIAEPQKRRVQLVGVGPHEQLMKTGELE